MSTVFHPQTDGASERSIRTIAQILHSMISPDQKDWAEKVPMVEFAINSSVSGSTGFAPFELTYGYMPQMAQVEHERAPKVVPGVQSFVRQGRDNLLMALDAIIESCVIQTHHANKRKASPTLDVGELVYLSTKNLTLPKGRARKLSPRDRQLYARAAPAAQRSKDTPYLPYQPPAMTRAQRQWALSKAGCPSLLQHGQP